MSRLFAGLDTVRVGLNCAGFTYGARSQMTGFGLLNLANGICLQELYGKPFMELSVPSFLHGTNVTPSNFRETHRALAECLEVVDAMCIDLDKTVDDLTVSRLDIAKDFTGIPRINAVLRALEQQSRRRNHKANLTSGGDTAAETLRLGPKRSMGQRLYNKSKESRDALPNTLRSEFQIRRPKLALKWVQDSIGNIGRFGEMTDEKIDRLGGTAFNHFGCDRTIVSPEDAITRVQNMELSRADKRGVMITLFMDACGHGDGVPAEQSTVKRWQRITKKLGLTLDFGATETVRLDWDTARLVAD